MPRQKETEGDRLTGKQKKFVEFYVGTANGNATKAARLAGYACPNPAGSRLLTNVSVRAAIDERLAPLVLSASEVLSRLSEHAKADVGDLDDLLSLDRADDGSVSLRLDLKAARRRGKSRLIKRIAMTRYGVSLELHDSQAALDKLARCHGLYKDQSQVRGDQPVETVILEHGDSDAGTGTTPPPAAL